MKKFITILLLSLFILTGCQVPTGGFNASSGVERISQGDFEALLEKNPATVLVDVRTPEEYDSGHIPGAVLLPVNRIQEIETLVPGKDTPVVVYCRSGNRSATAARELMRLGYQEVYDLGGIHAWRGALAQEARVA